jgi:hypothetical protein
MSARLTAIGAILGVVLLVAALAPHSAAQGGGEKGVFSTLRVGQMVDVRTDNIGIVISVYEDPAFKDKMRSRIVEIGRDYIAVDYLSPDETPMEMRYPVSSITVVTHIKKQGDRPGSKKRQ